MKKTIVTKNEQYDVTLSDEEVQQRKKEQFNNQKILMKSNIKTYQHEADFANLTVNGNIYIMNEKAQNQFLKMLTNMNAGILPTTINWTLADNSVIELDHNEIKTIMKEAQNRELKNDSHARILIDQIEAATTLDELEAVDITSGWVS